MQHGKESSRITGVDVFEGPPSDNVPERGVTKTSQRPREIPGTGYNLVQSNNNSGEGCTLVDGLWFVLRLSVSSRRLLPSDSVFRSLLRVVTGRSCLTHRCELYLKINLCSLSAHIYEHWLTLFWTLRF